MNTIIGLKILILAMLPVVELRGAIPLALVGYHLSVPVTLALAIIGTMLPMYFILLALDGVANWLRRYSPFFDRLLTWLFDHTRQKMHHQVERYGNWALVIIAATPLPALGGAWTAALAAFVFGIPKKHALLAILAGTIIAAIIVSMLTLGAQRLTG